MESGLAQQPAFVNKSVNLATRTAQRNDMALKLQRMVMKSAHALFD